MGEKKRSPGKEFQAEKSILKGKIVGKGLKFCFDAKAQDRRKACADIKNKVHISPHRQDDFEFKTRDVIFLIVGSNFWPQPSPSFSEISKKTQE